MEIPSQILVNDCRFRVSPVIYPDPDPDPEKAAYNMTSVSGLGIRHFL